MKLIRPASTNHTDPQLIDAPTSRAVAAPFHPF